MTDKELIQDLIKRGITLEAILNEILPTMKKDDIKEMRKWIDLYLYDCIYKEE